jgi:transposase
MITRWKQELLSRLPELFEKGKNRQSEGDETKNDDLLKIIGELKVENDWYKKKLKILE